MFYLYVFLTAMFAGDKAVAKEYWEKTEQQLVGWQDGTFQSEWAEWSGGLWDGVGGVE